MNNNNNDYLLSIIIIIIIIIIYLFYLAERGIKISLEQKQVSQVTDTNQEAIDEDTVWYHEGGTELLSARYWITEYSMPRYLIMSTHLEAIPYSAKFLKAVNFMKNNFVKDNFLHIIVTCHCNTALDAISWRKILRMIKKHEI